jgi:hypothetical protein
MPAGAASVRPDDTEGALRYCSWLGEREGDEVTLSGLLFLPSAWPRGSDVLKFRDATNVLTGSSTGEDTAPVFFFLHHILSWK